MQLKLITAPCEVCRKPFDHYASSHYAGRFCSKPCEAFGMTTPLQERIDAHLIDSDLPSWHPEYGICRTWTSPSVSNGYGRMQARVNDRRRPIGAHVGAWWAASGEFPARGLDVGHTCDVRLCAQNEGQGTYEVAGTLYPRWGHLWLGPRQANMLDAKLKERHVHGESHRQVMRSVAARGEDAGSAKLTDDDIREMRRLRSLGMKLREIADIFPTSEGNISMICRRLKWAHVT